MNKNFSLWFVILWQCGLAVGQDKPMTSESLERVSKYHFILTDTNGDPKELKLVSQSALNWSNPVYGTTDGGLFFWIDDRTHPMVAMKTYKTSKGRWFEQMRSFCTRPVVGRESKNGNAFWSPSDSAPEMKALIDAPAPRKTPISRLVQMKAIHRGFCVTGTIKKQDQQLRVYPRPLYRYKSDKVVDGAIMAFVQGTGPDVLLRLEAREVEGAMRWYYSIGSVGIFAIDVSYNGQSIWKEPRRSAFETKPTDVYNGRRLPE